MSLVSLGQRPPPSFDDPTAFLEACHRRIEANLATLARIVAALRENRRDEARAALAAPLHYFDHAARLHTEDEERSLLPRLREAGLSPPDLASEHRVHEAIYLAFRAAALRLDADEMSLHLEAMTAGLRDHIALEEREVFPLAAHLPPTLRRAIGLEMQARRAG